MAKRLTLRVERTPAAPRPAVRGAMAAPLTAWAGARGRVEKSELGNGVRILSEEIPELASVAIGLWIENGSRYEKPEHSGLSHFIEHLFFKGTERRSAAAIAEEIDGVGGVMNADTDREHTCCYAKVLGEHLELAIDLLSDVFLGSRFDAEDVTREKEVIFEEIAQIEDTPDDHIHDLFHAQYWSDHALGLPVCGTRASVERFDRAACMELIGDRYRPNRLVIAAAGRVRHERLVAEIGSRFGAMQGKASLDQNPPQRPCSGVTVHDRKLEQVQLCLGTAGVAVDDPQRDAAVVLNAALGDSPSSRLFQEVRERRGRAYSIDSFLCSYRDTGYIGIAAGTRAAWVAEVVEVVLGELRKIRRAGLSADELERVKAKLKGSLLLGLETSDQRMERLALSEMYLGREVPLAEVAARIDAVTNDAVVELAERCFVPEGCALILLGSLRGKPPGVSVFDTLA